MPEANNPRRLKELAQDILSERLDPRLGVECLLLVTLGLRPAAVITVPAELPGGPVLEAQIDYEFRDRMAGRGSLKTRMNDTVTRRKMSPLAFKTHLLRSCFDDQVRANPSYQTHRQALDTASLEVIDFEVRPSLREWFVFLPENRDRVEKLLDRRRAIQKEKRPQFRPKEDSLSFYVYPEQQDPEYVRDLGLLLGYPECCVEEFVKDVSPERPEEQPGPGRPGPPGAASTGTLWVQGFRPCRPECPEASDLVRRAREALAGVDDRLPALYDRLRAGHLEA